MKNFLKILCAFSVLFIVASCSNTTALSPIECNQLLMNVKDFFATSLFLLGGNASNFQIGQSIARFYYGNYHIARLIYNNKKHSDPKNHTDTWESMDARISAYGAQIKKLRIKYDYDPLNFTDIEIKKDLKFIYDNKSEFEYMVKQLNASLNNAYVDRIDAIKDEYNLLLNRIDEYLNAK